MCLTAFIPFDRSGWKFAHVNKIHTSLHLLRTTLIANLEILFFRHNIKRSDWWTMNSVSDESNCIECGSDYWNKFCDVCFPFLVHQHSDHFILYMWSAVGTSKMVVAFTDLFIIFYYLSIQLTSIFINWSVQHASRLKF